MAGIHSPTADNELENVFCKILYHVGANINDENIDSWVNKNTDRTIVIFLSRKYWHHFMRVKTELKKLKLANLDRPEETRVYINKSLCPYYRALWNQCKSYGTGTNCFSLVHIRLWEKESEAFSDEDFVMF